MENADIRTADNAADSGQQTGKLVENAGTLKNGLKIRKKCLNKIFPFMSAFSTLVENADTLENAQKTRKNVRIIKKKHWRV